MPYRFNSALLQQEYELPDEARLTMSDEVKGLADDARRLVDLADTAPSLFPGLTEGRDCDRLAARDKALARIADPASVVSFYRLIHANSRDMRSPDPDVVSSDWAHIRWLQVKLMYALDLHTRYQGRLSEQLTPGVRLRLEHDLHDAQVLTLGILEGALATREKKLATWFKHLQPDGELIR